jgi:hypothetical protein
MTWGGLEVARLAGKDKADWIGMLKAGACALLSAAEELRPILGEKAGSLLAPVAALQGLACGGAK